MDPLTLSWTSLLYLAVGAVGGALAKHVMSGAKPVVDPQNQRPLVDAVRDAVRTELVSLFGGGAAPLPPPAPSPAPSPADNPLLQVLQQVLEMLKAHQPQPPAPPK